MAARLTRARGESIIRIWQHRLGLERWDLSILWDEPADAEDNARVWRSSWYEIARLYFSAEWPSWPVAKFEQIVVHELVHLLHRGLDEAFADLNGQLHRDAWTLAEARFKQENEGFVDRLAFRLVEIASVA